MQTTFEAVSEAIPGIKWQNIFRRTWPLYKRWYLSQGTVDRPSYQTCRNRLIEHMPELIPVYDQLRELTAGSSMASRFLSLYCPPAYISGCSQLIWPAPEARLIRNYDYSPRRLDGVILNSSWLGKNVIAMSDCLIGVLDGMNEDGLCVSLTFGGSRQVGKGFGIPIILRYILETCENSKQAQLALERIPTHMAYNVTVIDAHGDYFTAHLFPGKDTIIDRKQRIATNHQPHDIKWESYADASATLDREAELEKYLALGHMNFQQVASAFHYPPLYSTDFKGGFSTLYTSIYYPNEKVVELRWPDSNWILNFPNFSEGMRTISYRAEGAVTIQNI